MTEKLTESRATADPPPTAIGVARSPTRQEPAPDRLAQLAGPAIGFALAGLLAISLAIALAGGAGQAALGSSGSAHPARTAIFVL